MREAVFRSDGHVRSGDLAFAPLFRLTLQRLYVLNKSTYLIAAAFSRRTRALNVASGRPWNVEQILIIVQRFGASEWGLREAQLLCHEVASWWREEAEGNATSEDMERELQESLSTGQVVIIGSADAALKPSHTKKSQINLMKPFGHAGSLLAIGLLILQTFKSKPFSSWSFSIYTSNSCRKKFHLVHLCCTKNQSQVSKCGWFQCEPNEPDVSAAWQQQF